MGTTIAGDPPPGNRAAPAASCPVAALRQWKIAETFIGGCQAGHIRRTNCGHGTGIADVEVPIPVPVGVEQGLLAIFAARRFRHKRRGRSLMRFPSGIYVWPQVAFSVRHKGHHGTGLGGGYGLNFLTSTVSRAGASYADPHPGLPPQAGEGRGTVGRAEPTCFAISCRLIAFHYAV